MTTMRPLFDEPPDVILDPAADTLYMPALRVDSPAGRWPTALHVIAAGGLLLGHVLGGDQSFSVITRLCAGIQAAATFLFATRYLALRLPRLPWIEFILAVHYLEFALPIFAGPAVIDAVGATPLIESYESAACLALASCAALVTGFALAFAVLPRFRWDTLLPPLSPASLVRGSHLYVPIACAFLLATTVPSLSRALEPSGNLSSQFISAIEMTVVAGMAYLVRPNLYSTFQLFLAIGVLVVLVAVSSMLNEAVIPLAGLVLVWWRMSRRFPWLPAGLAIATFLVLQPVKGYYRSLRWQGRSDIGALQAWGQAFEQASTNSRSSFSTDPSTSNATIGRLDSLTTLAYVVEVVPHAIPHTGGRIYPLMAASFVPRLLWPDKPDMTKYALDPFVIALGLTTKESAEHTTIGLTLESEGYLEHGILGSIGWTALFGLLIGWTARYFGTTLIGALAGCCIMVPLGLATEGGFFSCFGGLWQTLLGTTLFAWLIYFLGRPGREGSVASAPSS